MTDDEVLALHRAAPLTLAYMNPAIDCQADGGIRYSTWANGSACLQAALPNLRAGSVDVAVVSFGLNHPELFPGRAAVGRIVQMLGAFAREVRQHADQVAIARDAEELAAILASGRLACVLHLTGVPLDGAIEVLHAYHDLGVRCIHAPFDTLTEARPRAWQGDHGLSAFGRDVVREMAALGMVVDLAHANERMAFELLDLVDAPVIVSHTMCRAMVDSARNTSDALHRAVAERGGVIGIHFAGQLIDERYGHEIAASGFREELAAWEAGLHREFPEPFAFMAARFDYARWMQTEAYRLQQSVEPPQLALVVDHLDHLLETVGPAHVGLGTDYELGNIPRDVDRAEKLPNLTRAMVARGYAAADIQGILGGNFLRIFS